MPNGLWAMRHAGEQELRTRLGRRERQEPDQHRSFYAQLPFIDGGPPPGDLATSHLFPGQPLGLLGVELSTRRRNRANGVVRERAAERVVIDVVQSYGNCPRYIQKRGMVVAPSVPAVADIEVFTKVNARLSAMIAGADTVFVASYNGGEDIRNTGGVDVSHRGGRAGFVKVRGDVLTFS